MLNVYYRIVIFLFIVRLDGASDAALARTKNDYLKHLISIKLNRVERIIKRSQEVLAGGIENKETGVGSGGGGGGGHPVFKPKQVEPATPDEDYGEVLEEYYDYYNDELPSETFDKIPDLRVTTGSPKWTTKNSSALSKFNLKTLFDFVEIILRPTSPNENTVESACRLKYLGGAYDNISQQLGPADDGFWENGLDLESQENQTTETTTSSSTKTVVALKNESLGTAWYLKDNVCYSKITYQRDSKTQPDYWFINSCKSKFDSEFCVTNIQAGYKSFELHSTLFCCPNYQLNSKTDTCEPYSTSETDLNLFADLKTSFSNLGITLHKFFDLNELSSESIVQEFLLEITSIYDELTNEVFNQANSTKYTIYLWDNTKFIDYIKSVLAYNDFNLSQKLEKILNTVRNHIVKFHHPTQAIASNDLELETLAKKKLRFSTIILENKSMEFVNCKEVVLKNQYHKHVQDGSGADPYNYRLLIHKLQTGSIVTPLTKTVFQILNEKILKPTLVKNNFKIFQKMFAQSQDRLTADLNKQLKTSAITLFVPTDDAFKSSLRNDQIESLVADKSCGYKFLFHNIVYEEVCPTQLIKYGAEYSSNNQRANFIAVNENSNNFMYFNGQIVNLSKSSINTAANGMIYRLSSLNLNGVVDFLYDNVVSFKKRIPSNFLAALSSNWLDVVKTESNNSTLFFPLEEKSTVGDSKSFSENASGNNTIVTALDSLSINDYIIKPRFTLYELNDGQVLSSMSNKKFLVNVYQLENPLDFMSFIPSRNFQRKTINCASLELSDFSSCNAQLIVYKSENNQIPLLNTQTVLDFIAYHSDLSAFSSLIEMCGPECKSLFSSLGNEMSVAVQQRRRGFTLILPSNSYFNKHAGNFTKFMKNLPLLKKQLQSNIIHGTFCYNFMKSSAVVENLLNRRIQAKKIYARITEGNVYLSETGVIIHKSDLF